MKQALKQGVMAVCLGLCAGSSVLQGQEPDSLYRRRVEPADGSEHIVNFGLKAGFTSTLFLVPCLVIDGVRVEEVQNNYRIGYFGSFFMRINFKQHFLQPEISYHVNRCDITFDHPLPDGAPEGTEPWQASISSEIHSIDIPVIYGYNVVKEGPYSLAVFGGPKIRYILTKQSGVAFDGFGYEDIHESLRPLNLSVTMGVAVTISRVFFDFRYDIGMHNISRKVTYRDAVAGNDQEAAAGSGISFERRDNVLSFSLGVFF